MVVLAVAVAATTFSLSTLKSTLFSRLPLSGPLPPVGGEERPSNPGKPKAALPVWVPGSVASSSALELYDFRNSELPTALPVKSTRIS